MYRRNINNCTTLLLHTAHTLSTCSTHSKVAMIIKISFKIRFCHLFFFNTYNKMYILQMHSGNSFNLWKKERKFEKNVTYDFNFFKAYVVFFLSVWNTCIKFHMNTYMYNGENLISSFLKKKISKEVLVDWCQLKYYNTIWIRTENIVV